MLLVCEMIRAVVDGIHVDFNDAAVDHNVA